MSEHRISLTRVVALNWYGFRQIIDVTDNILVSGAFGTGKSVILDLIQHALLGEHWRPNRAAAGNKRGRTLASYCLCDTNLTRDGEPHYMRRSGVTLIALEFTWPGAPKGQEPRRETWGMRIEYTGPDAKPKHTYFGVPDRLTWEILAPEGAFHTEDAFRTMLRRDYGPDTVLPTQRAYLEEMATPRHLYFDREQLNKTLWKSIAFEPEGDIESFIREFILEDSPLDVTDVKKSVGAYRDTERTLALQRAECELLREVCRHDVALHAARREHSLCKHLGLYLEERRLTELVARHTSEIAELEARHAEDNAGFDIATQLVEKLERQLEEFTLDRDESDLVAAQKTKKEIYENLNRAREAAQGLRAFLRDHSQRWSSWLRRGGEYARETTSVAESLNVPQSLLDALVSRNEVDAIAVLPKLAEHFQEVFTIGTTDLLQPIAKRLEAMDERLQTIVKHLELLDRNETPGTFPLLREVQARMPTGARAEQLCRLIEVRPECEEWRAALEALLGRQRFSIIVAMGEPYSAALKALRQSPPGTRGPEEALVHPREAEELEGRVREGSLWDKVQVRCEDEALRRVAEPFTRHLLGAVAAVESVDDLDDHDRGITRDCIYKLKPVRRKLRQMTGFEYTLGTEGLKRLAAVLLREQRELMLARAEMERQRDAIRNWLDDGKKAKLGNASPPERDAALGEIPKLEARLEELKSSIRFLETPERTAKLEARAKITADLGGAHQKLGELKSSRQNYSLKRKTLGDALDEAGGKLEIATTAAEQSRGKLPTSVSQAIVEERANALLLAFANWVDRQFEAGEAANAASTAEINARHARLDARRALREAVTEHGSPRFPQWRYEEIEDLENVRWQSRFDTLDGTEIPRYEQLVIDRRAEWEQRLREQVLNRLNENLTLAEETVRQLRRYLDRPVGLHRYHVTQRRDTAYATLWTLLDSGFKPTDELLSTSRDRDVQAALEQLMAAVELDGSDGDIHLRRLLDYRHYHHYDLEATRADLDASPDMASISLGRRGSSLSGGENQAPFFISILAAFRRVYDVGGGRAPHLGLVVMDEAFSKLSGDGVEDCLELARNFNLQLLMAFPVDKLGVMARYAETTILCRKEESHDARGFQTRLDNIPIVLTSEQALEAIS